MAKLLDTGVSYWTEYSIYEGTALRVWFPLAICVSYQKGKRGKTGLLVHAYAVCERPVRMPKQIEQAYKQGSAIETSFRTFREALAKTTTGKPDISLVYVGVAFLVRNLWILVGWVVLATPRRGGRTRPSWFLFKRFRNRLRHTLNEKPRCIWKVPTNGVGILPSHRSAIEGWLSPRQTRTLDQER